jgi:Arc/MetJ-type ribon-helix-helix transcriptional regulator
MVGMTTTITFRTDPETERALAELTADGTSQSAVIREAVLAAHQRRQAERLRAETEALAADPDDLAEVRAIQSELESLRAW